jgi:YVTN family beta-propeller protein
VLAGLIALVTAAMSAGVVQLSPGPQPDGTSVTPQGWRVTPAGTQTDLGSGPLDIAVSPAGGIALVANAGYGNHTLMVVDTATGGVIQTITTQSNALRAETNRVVGRVFSHFYYYGGQHGFYSGLAFSPDGSRAYAADGPGSAIHAFTVQGKTLIEGQEIGIDGDVWPAGIAVSPDGARLYVAANLADTLYVVDAATRKVLGSVAVGHLPLDVALDHSGATAYVSSWGGTTVVPVDVASLTTREPITVGSHPSALALNPRRDELYVADTDSDTITVINTAQRQVARTFTDRPFEGAGIGASPNGLAVSPDGTTLYVANAGDNDVAVLPLADGANLDAQSGLIPTGWYPSGVAIDSSGKELLVINMKGLGVGPIQPGQYVGVLMHGTLSSIPVPDATQLEKYTAQVAENDRFTPPQPAAGNVVPVKAGDNSPIKHVIFVIKENRTYDQILGDLEKGNGDPSLTMFGEEVTPNQHALARRFVTLDNFFCDGEVSADGWIWSTASYANTYVQKNWPLDYSIWGRPYDFGGFAGVAADPNNTETAAFPGPDPKHAFIWDGLAAMGISYRNYGFFLGPAPVIVPASMPGLVGHTDLAYSGWDLKLPDQARIDEWVKEFAAYVASGDLPAVEFVYLPRDHTMNTASGQPAPTAMVADNDLAVGRLVEAVSHSKFWPETAIFIVEDDAQDGPDHVEMHRTVAQVISPYTQTGRVDSTFYSTVSMLRTLELIMGIPPLTQFDAAATPMSASFSTTPGFQTYDAITPMTSLTATNSAAAPMAALAATWDYSVPDRIPTRLANLALWKSLKGRQPIPASMRKASKRDD